VCRSRDIISPFSPSGLCPPYARTLFGGTRRPDPSARIFNRPPEMTARPTGQRIAFPQNCLVRSAGRRQHPASFRRRHTRQASNPVLLCPFALWWLMHVVYFDVVVRPAMRLRRFHSSRYTSLNRRENLRSFSFDLRGVHCLHPPLEKRRSKLTPTSAAPSWDCFRSRRSACWIGGPEPTHRAEHAQSRGLGRKSAPAPVHEKRQAAVCIRLGLRGAPSDS